MIPRQFGAESLQLRPRHLLPLPMSTLEIWMPSAKKCGALRFMAERKVGSSEANPIFSNCCPGEKLTVQHIPLLQEPPYLLRELLTGSTPRDKGSARILLSITMLCAWLRVHANWVSRGEGQSNFNPTVTLQGRIHHFLGALQPAPGRGRLSCLCTFTTPTLMYSLSSDPIISQVFIAIS